MSGRGVGGQPHRARCLRLAHGRGNIVVTTPEEARAAMQRKKELGYDIIKLNEFLPFDLSKVVVDEAHRLGMPVAAHSWDAMRSRRPASTPSSTSGRSVTARSCLKPARHELAEHRLAGKIEQEIAGAYYQPENYDGSSTPMVKHKVAWTPTIAKWLRPLSPSAERFRERENEILNNPNADLAAYGAGGDRQRLRQAASALHACTARPRQDRLRKGERVYPSLCESRRHPEGRLRPAARHGGAPDASGAGDGCRGRASRR